MNECDDNGTCSLAGASHYEWMFGLLTQQPAVVPAVVEEQLLIRVDLRRGTEEQLPVGRVGHQVLLLVGP